MKHKGEKHMKASEMMHPKHMPGMTPIKITDMKKKSGKGKKSGSHGY